MLLNPSNPNYKHPWTHIVQVNLAQAEVPATAIARTAQVNAFLAQLTLLNEELWRCAQAWFWHWYILSIIWGASGTMAFDSVSIFLFYPFLFPFLCYLIVNNIVQIWWKVHVSVTLKLLHCPSHGNLILWHALVNVYHWLKKFSHCFFKPRFCTWIHTSDLIFIQHSTINQPHFLLLPVCIAIIWKFFQSIAILETLARNLVLSILKTFHTFILFILASFQSLIT